MRWTTFAPQPCALLLVPLAGRGAVKPVVPTTHAVQGPCRKPKVVELLLLEGCSFTVWSVECRSYRCGRLVLLATSKEVLHLEHFVSMCGP